jgi:type IV pilus assembly protein PilF
VELTRYKFLVALGAAVLMLSAGCVSSDLKKSSTSPKEAAQLNMQLGISYLRKGDLKSAQEKLEKSIADDDSLATAFQALGLVFERLGDLPGAERNYREAVSLAPEDPDALNALGVFLCLRKQEPENAMRYFDRALAIPLSKAESNKAMLNSNAGLCVKSLDLARAEGYLRNALNFDPSYKDALLLLADVSYSRSNYLQARAFLERYLAANRVTPDALWIGVRVERALGQTAVAREYAERLKKEFPESVEVRLLLESERDAG